MDISLSAQPFHYVPLRWAACRQPSDGLLAVCSARINVKLFGSVDGLRYGSGKVGKLKPWGEGLVVSGGQFFEYHGPCRR
jgi:hypothetical protein